MNVEYFFPTPIWFEFIEDITSTDLTNLRDYCLALSENYPSVHKSNHGGWQSDGFHINSIENESLKKLMCILSVRVANLSHRLNPPESLGIDNIWINVNRRGHHNIQHIHPNTLLSGVFYIWANSDSGDLVFTRTNISDNLLYSLICQNLEFFAKEKVRHRPQTGKLVLFPAWIPHEVDVNTTDSARISLAFNINYISQIKHETIN